MKAKILILITYLLILIGLISCRKDEQNIPITAVNIRINLTLPEYNNLNAVGNSVEISGGSRGIIIYRKSNTEYKAFDKHCPYDITNPCGIVQSNDNAVTAIDSCCGSEFLLSDGSVLTGPSSLPLTEYNTSLEGNFLNIFN